MIFDGKINLFNKDIAINTNESMKYLFINISYHILLYEDAECECHNKKYGLVIIEYMII